MSEKLLILSANDETAATLADMLSEILEKIGSDGISVSKNGGSVRDKFKKNTPCEYGMVIVSPPLEDEYGLSAVEYIAENSDAAIIIMVSQKNAEAVFNKISETGAIVLPKPVNKISLFQTVNFMSAERKRRKAAREKYSALSEKLAETKIIDRAKCVLVEYLRLSEAEAHRHMQKQAMDMRQPLITVAEDILKNYEYLE